MDRGNYDEIGELWLTGENVALGYRENQCDIRDVLRDEQGRRWLKPAMPSGRQGLDSFSSRTGSKYVTSPSHEVLLYDSRLVTRILSKLMGCKSHLQSRRCLLDHPDHLINDAAVAGVTLKGMVDTGTRSQEPGLVLSPLGRKTGKKRTTEALEAWMKQTLAKYKWLKGGIEYVDEVPLSIQPSGFCTRLC